MVKLAKLQFGDLKSFTFVQNRVDGFGSPLQTLVSVNCLDFDTPVALDSSEFGLNLVLFFG